MNLQQLRSFRQVVHDGMNLTRAAASLHTSQPSITRHLKSLEQELDAELFERGKGRLVKLSGAGRLLLPVILRALNAIEDLHHIADSCNSGAIGDLTIASAPTQMRRALPPVVIKFISEFPNIHVRLRQGTRNQLAAWVAAGEADLCVCTLPAQHFPDVLFIPSYDLHHGVYVPAGHPLLRVKQITIQDISSHPIITYDRDYTSRGDIERAFADRGVRLQVAVSTTDTETMKTFVLAGVGIGIMAVAGYDKKRDPRLRVIDARHIFKSSSVQVGVRRDGRLPPHTLRFLELFAPGVHSEILRRMIDVM